MRLIYLLALLLIAPTSHAADSGSSNGRGSVGQVANGSGDASAAAVIVPVVGTAVVSMGVSLAVGAAGESTRPVTHVTPQPNAGSLPISSETVTATLPPANQPAPARQNETRPAPPAKP